jgi:hypothetical protein
MIPLLFHQIWIGGKLPPAQKAIYKHNKSLLIGWKCKLWGDKDLTKKNFPRTWTAIQKSKRMAIISKQNRFAQISDLMRYEILYHHGGVYMDAGMEVTKNLSPLVDAKTTLLIANEWGDWQTVKRNDYSKRYMSNSFIGSVPHGEYVDCATSTKMLSKINFKSRYINETTGPVYWFKCIKREKGVKLLRRKEIYPFNWYEGPCAFNDTAKPFTDKTISIKRLNSKQSLFQDRCKRLVFISIGSLKKHYPDSFAVKHWDLGGSWV